MPEIQQRPRCNLILHCCGSAVPRVEVERVTTPRQTETWQPIPHVTLITEVENALRSTGLKIGNQVHSLTQDGARYFGFAEVHNGNDAEDYAMVVGIRNSHDKTFPVGLLAGTNILICDNLAFSGEVRISRKHTSNLLHDLPGLVASGVGRLSGTYRHADGRCHPDDRRRRQPADYAATVEDDVESKMWGMVPAFHFPPPWQR
jgi:hypothetical protein